MSLTQREKRKFKKKSYLCTAKIKQEYDILTDLWIFIINQPQDFSLLKQPYEMLKLISYDTDKILIMLYMDCAFYLFLSESTFVRTFFELEKCRHYILKYDHLLSIKKDVSEFQEKQTNKQTLFLMTTVPFYSRGGREGDFFFFWTATKRCTTNLSELRKRKSAPIADGQKESNLSVSPLCCTSNKIRILQHVFKAWCNSSVNIPLDQYNFLKYQPLECAILQKFKFSQGSSFENATANYIEVLYT